MTQNAMESDNRNQQTNEELKQTRKLTNHRKLVLPIFGNTARIMRHLGKIAIGCHEFFCGPIRRKAPYPKG